MKKTIALLFALLFTLGLASAACASVKSGEVTGLVTAVYENSFTVSTVKGSSMTFFRESGLPAVASVVTVEYSGESKKLLMADKITVESKARKKNVTGTVLRVSSKQVTVETNKGTVLNIALSKSTVISGKAEKLKKKQTVKVYYSENDSYISEVAIATEIKITGVEEKKETPTNKKLSGTVTKLSSSKITIRTNKGKTWSFRLNEHTSYSNKSKLKKGCTVTVTYDGYASSVPAAKKVKVTKSPDPERKTYVKKGYCSYFEGGMIGLEGGFEADVAGTFHTGNGYRGPGTRVKVTYYKSNGMNYATRVKWYDDEVEEETYQSTVSPWTDDTGSDSEG